MSTVVLKSFPAIPCQSQQPVEGGDLGTGDDPLNFLPQEELLGIILGDGLGKNGESEYLGLILKMDF